MTDHAVRRAAAPAIRSPTGRLGFWSALSAGAALLGLRYWRGQGEEEP